MSKNENAEIRVNFDASLIRLLKEVKYFNLLDLKD